MSRSPRTTRWLLASLLLIASTAPAAARAEKTLAYPRDAVWPTAVRFLRVDEGLKILEKDAEAGYVIFELKEEGKAFRGSLEVITAKVDGRTVVRFVMQIEDRPSWIEIAMLTRLERKLRAELGSPAPAPARPRREPDARPTPDGDGEPPKSNDPPRPDEGGPPVSPTP